MFTYVYVYVYMYTYIYIHIEPRPPKEFGTMLPNKQRQHRALHIQKDVLPCALCW